MPSLITFGPYVFPASFRLATKDQAVTIDSVKVPMLDGESIPVGSRNAQKVTLMGTVGGSGIVDSFGNEILNRDQANAELNLMASSLFNGYQQLRTGNADLRYLAAQCSDLKHTYQEANRQAVCAVEVDFTAPDPRWLSNAPNTITGLASGATATVPNAGSAIAFPVITIATSSSGECVNPQIIVRPYLAPGALTMNFTTTLVSSSSLIVDGNPRNRINAVVINGVPSLFVLSSEAAISSATGNSAMFPYLAPGGGNTITVNCAGATWGVSWQDAYMV